MANSRLDSKNPDSRSAAPATQTPELGRPLSVADWRIAAPKIEQAICAKIDDKRWSAAHHLLQWLNATPSSSSEAMTIALSDPNALLNVSSMQSEAAQKATWNEGTFKRVCSNFNQFVPEYWEGANVPGLRPQLKRRTDYDGVLYRLEWAIPPNRKKHLGADSSPIGIIDSFKDNYTDFMDRFRNHARAATQEIIGIGLGLSFLAAHHHENCDAIRERIRDVPDLQVRILLADKSNPGLRQRYDEEHDANSVEGKVGYEDDWPARFPRDIKRELTRDLSAKDRKRVNVGTLDFLPMIMLIKVDDTYFFSPYGSPVQLGWMSPWLVFQRPAAEDHWLSFFDRFIDYAQRHTNGEVDARTGLTGVDADQSTELRKPKPR